MATEIRRRLCASLCLIAILLISACRSTKEMTVRIGVNPWPGYDFVSIAETLEYFKKNGLDIKIVDLSSTGDARRAFERGQVDVFAGSLVELLITQELSSRKAKILFVTDFSNGADMLLAKPEIHSVSELRGKRVGVEPLSLDSVAVLAALKQYGMTFRDIERVEMPQNELPVAFQQGKLDAVEVYPPNCYTLLRDTPVNKIFDSSQAPKKIVDILAVDASFENRPEVIRALLASFKDAKAFIRSNPEEALRMMAVNERLSPEEVKESLNGISLLEFSDQEPFLRENGEIHKALFHNHEALIEIGGLPVGQFNTAQFLLNLEFYR